MYVKFKNLSCILRRYYPPKLNAFYKIPARLTTAETQLSSERIRVMGWLQMRLFCTQTLPFRGEGTLHVKTYHKEKIDKPISLATEVQ